MVEIRIDGDAATFEILGMHKLWALRSRIHVPLTSIRDLRVVTDLSDASESGRKWLRVPGTHIPGLIKAGTFRSAGRSVFWDVGRAGKAIIVDLAHEEFDSLVIDVADPAKAVDTLRKAVGNVPTESVLPV